LKMTAALLVEVGAPLRLEEIELDPPRAGEVLVRMVTAGVCHSDLHYIDGAIPRRLPLIPGHEGGGEVVDVGPGVTSVAPGDHVVVTFLPSCGRCRWCEDGEPTLCDLSRRLREGTMPDGSRRVRQKDGSPIDTLLFVSAFAEYTTLPEASVVKVGAQVPWERLALLGCGFTTGFSAVTRSIGLRAGESVTVIGCGGVGLAAIQAARLQGAQTIVAADVDSAKLELARRFGATDTVVADDAARSSVREVTGGLGTDYAIEAVGGDHHEKTLALAFHSVRKGGTVCVLGLGKAEQRNMPISPLALVTSRKRVIGSLFGDSRFRVDIPRYLELAERGLIDLEGLVSRSVPFEEINDAVDKLRDGAVMGRTILTFDEKDTVARIDGGTSPEANRDE
jgi:S-(hydroxymethyl)glutathione dehydrogenase/alcohol dehydrogenase